MTIQMVVTAADQALLVEGRFQWAIEGTKARRLIARYRHHLRRHGVEAAGVFLEGFFEGRAYAADELGEVVNASIRERRALTDAEYARLLEGTRRNIEAFMVEPGPEPPVN
jgi:hypothetical protein